MTGLSDVTLVLGPTASGKTALAVRLARAAQASGRDAWVVNMDSMQVYADLSVLTARPTPDEMEGIPHLLFGHVDAAVRYSTGRWLRDVSGLIEQAKDQGIYLIFVGGTGLYAETLTRGLADVPDIPEDLAAQIRAEVAADRAGALARLNALDPDGAAALKPNDTSRIARALSVLDATGRTLQDWQGTPAAPVLAAGRWQGVVVELDRVVLYARIEARFEAMMSAGVLDEAQALWTRQLDRDLPAMRAHGMPGFCDYFEGRTSLDQAIARAVLDTRHYAKRQLTWARNRCADWRRVAPDWDGN